MTDLTIVSTLGGKIKVSPGKQPLAWLMESILRDMTILVSDLLAGMVLYSPSSVRLRDMPDISLQVARMP